MDYALQPHLYKNVPVYLWPWVWWQLFQIECWIKQTGRMVLGGVARDGKVYVLHVADDPNERKPWSPRDMARYRTRHDAWLRGLCPYGEVEFNPALSPSGTRGKAGSGLAAPAHEPG